jgi:hypothetical protein
VTKEVSEVWTVDPFSPYLRKICRGLSIGQDGQVWVGTHDFDGGDFIVNVLEKKQYPIASTPCCIKRLDVHDFNDETCPLRLSQIVFLKNSITEVVYPELVKVLAENPREGTELGDLTSFLNPEFGLNVGTGLCALGTFLGQSLSKFQLPTIKCFCWRFLTHWVQAVAQAAAPKDGKSNRTSTICNWQQQEQHPSSATCGITSSMNRTTTNRAFSSSTGPQAVAQAAAHMGGTSNRASSTCNWQQQERQHK